MRGVPSDRPLIRLRDIVENIDAIADYVGDLDQEGLRNDRKTRDACERCLMRISEASVKLGKSAENLIPDYPWSEVRGLGNHLRHAYDRIDPDVVWEIVNEDLPVLRAKCRAVISRLDRETE